MKLGLWFAAITIALLALVGPASRAQDRDRERERHDDHPSFSDHDRDNVRSWYRDHRAHPPKGFRDKDRLPPDLQRRLVVHEVLAPELRSRIVAVPADVVRLLPPPPVGCRYVVLGGEVVLIDAHTWMVHDIVDVRVAI